jgi:hypothetical protein
MVHNKQLNKINKTPTIIINKGLKPLDIRIESRIILNEWLNEKKKEKHCCSGEHLRGVIIVLIQ